MLDRFPDQARVNGSGRIHAERTEAKFPQTVNQAAVTTPDVEDSRGRGRCSPELSTIRETPGPDPGYRQIPAQYPERVNTGGLTRPATATRSLASGPG
jgi:hypothetical protein